jgi:hypothetical protein
VTVLPGLLAYVVPVTLLAAVSPVMFLNASTIATNFGMPGVVRFVSGNALVLAVLAVLSVGLLGAEATRFAEEELASGVVDATLGVLLIAYGVYLLRHHLSDPVTGADQRDQAGRRGLFTWGLLGMATNYTTLPLFASATQHIGVSRLPLLAITALVLAVMMVVLVPAWAPGALLRLAPAHPLVSDGLRGRVAAGARVISILACFLGGGVLVIHALV